MSKKMLLTMLVCLVALAVAPFTVYGADKLIVQDSSSVTQFVVTDDGKVGIGTGTPGWAGEISKTGANAAMVVTRTDGARNFINATGSYGQFGTTNNYPLRLLINSTWKMTINADSSIAMANGATLTAGGVWTDNSVRDSKENIQELSAAAANEALKGLIPMTYNYKIDKGDKHVGFIAEEVPELVAAKDRKGLSPMDIVAVLTKVVKEQKQTVENLEATVARLEAEVSRLKNK
jgi:hypothetical protein